MKRYADLCCTPKCVDELKEILSKKVQIKYQTNDEIPHYADGRENVTKLFQKLNHGKKERTYDDCKEFNENYLLDLKGFEVRYEKGKINKYAFHEKTIFSFKEKKDHSYKIILIDTHVKKSVLPCIQVPDEHTD
jgi:hypothetical protein